MSKESEVITFGCRLNIYESEIIKQDLKKNVVTNTSVFNSCAVTSESVKKIKREIRKKKKESPNRKIVVTGCAAQIEPETFQRMPEVDQVIGNIEKRHIHSNLEKNNRVEVQDIMSLNNSLNGLKKGYNDRTRAFVEIQNGCNHRCTFCIIPYARGNLRSKKNKSIIKEIKTLIVEGHKEIILTGVDIASWGQDFEKEGKLGELVKDILKELPKLERLRLSTMDVIGFDNILIENITQNDRILPHIHLSLQSGDNMILKRMKRRHSREEAIKLCDRLKKARPEISFGADLIVGFPTESEEMFQNTLKIVDECRLDWIHVFPFSPRPGTPAAKMPQIDISVIRERARILRSKAHNKKKTHLIGLVGHKKEVFIEKNNKGYTNQFAPIKLLENELDYGKSINALIVDADDDFGYAIRV
ncbi:MAG TPA: tRNA (N(6)-L-threonylcarbamoyladenosine(37)-C(2))-methylthiotransferase MtaB [Flavobacteriales bacterium]|jgi:threonylcarbamoyladenosine tRNA methylthiotransferase MtaB|nr:tRNA (N(6)-L-threonylcarbamoyladenosine(37)-C(2))-methylthiotransferase MtaB [Flavobacteriales bacterium]